MKLRFQSVQKAQHRLSQMLLKLQNARLKHTFDEDDLIAYRDSVIKRFEIAYDATWKFLKLYFENHLALSVSSPKSTFHTCLQQGLTTEDETRTLLNMIDDRNLTVHTYNEDLAEQVSLRVIAYQKCMQNLIAKISITLKLTSEGEASSIVKRKASRKKITSVASSIIELE